ncbi:MAG: glutathione S-transferase family protein [Sphingomonadaceae bacterium]
MTLKLIIGNKAYSSWSLRGWLACRQSGLPFEETVVPLYDGAWMERRASEDLAPSSGRVPILWDGDTVVWDSLAILEHLNEKTGNTRFWPTEPAARAMARSIAAEMHASFAALRTECSMNLRRTFPETRLSDEATSDVARIQRLWAQARARFGGSGDFLFGDFGAADIMFAPVVTRFVTYAVPVSRFAERYIDAVTAHPFMQDWIAAAHEEDWVIDKYEGPIQP